MRVVSYMTSWHLPRYLTLSLVLTWDFSLIPCKFFLSRLWYISDLSFNLPLWHFSFTTNPHITISKDAYSTVTKITSFSTLPNKVCQVYVCFVTPVPSYSSGRHLNFLFLKLGLTSTNSSSLIKLWKVHLYDKFYNRNFTFMSRDDHWCDKSFPSHVYQFGMPYEPCILCIPLPS